MVTRRTRALCRSARQSYRAQPAFAAARSYRAPAVLAAAASILLVAGCGGGSRADAHERAGSFAVSVVHASFPSAQSIARQTKLELDVRNTGTTTVPNVAVTVDSFNYASSYPGLADRKRPIWVIESG